MRILSVDYGDSRTGLAICDEGEILASPLCVISEKDMESCARKVADAAEENGAKLIVVGNPINMNGTIGPRCELCGRFAEMLRGIVGCEVVMWDERRSTVTAAAMLNDVNKRGKKRREFIDSAAAAVILDSYLAYRKNRAT